MSHKMSILTVEDFDEVKSLINIPESFIANSLITVDSILDVINNSNSFMMFGLYNNSKKLIAVSGVSFDTNSLSDYLRKDISMDEKLIFSFILPKYQELGIQNKMVRARDEIAFAKGIV